MTPDPYVSIKQVGRWTYSVALIDGGMTVGPDSYVRGRKRAERLARRLLRRHLLRLARERNHWKIAAKEIPD
jgi:hypothetical protein